MTKEFRTKVEEALRMLVDNDANGTNYLCSNWVLISEWADFEGSRYLHTEVSEAMTPWNAVGMMRLAEEYNSELVIDNTQEEDEDA